LVHAAAVVELVHLATLVHDDIMDSADLRRGRGTAMRRYGPEAAVLLGDALFAHALNLAAQFPTPEVCLTVSDSTRKVCTGEIMQTLRRRTLDVTRADYDRVIELKTAELFRVSCLLGARLAGYPPAFAAAAAEFGRQLGIAYQIYDDLADYFGDETRIGKTLGTDLRSGKLTLPLLLLRERLPPGGRAVLDEEIAGLRPADLPAHLRQMREHDVFSTVQAAVASALAAAESALAPHAGLPPASRLLGLADALRQQTAALRG
jgi:octaprenyl-diphosphate synthase